MLKQTELQRWIPKEMKLKIQPKPIPMKSGKCWQQASHSHPPINLPEMKCTCGFESPLRQTTLIRIQKTFWENKKHGCSQRFKTNKNKPKEVCNTMQPHMPGAGANWGYNKAIDGHHLKVDDVKFYSAMRF